MRTAFIFILLLLSLIAGVVKAPCDKETFTERFFKGASMEQRQLGRQGLSVSVLGLGCMGMSWAYGKPNDAESIAVIHEALERGMNFFDTAEIYGPFENEKLLGRALKGKRAQAVIATKFGFNFTEGQARGLNSRPENVKAVADACLQRLDTDVIDLYYQHRVDPDVPIEDTVGAMAELVAAGKVRYLGLSEAGAATIRRAHAVHPISALQYEYSLWERDVENDILPVARELGIGFVPFSPLGRGFLTGQYQSLDEFEEGDWRRTNSPRFNAENLDHNLKLVESVKELAAQKSITPGQLALAWVLHQGDYIVPIPGTKRRTYLRENLAAADVKLSVDELAWLNERLPVGAATGDRYLPGMMKMLDR
jgi:aryl-alcohol dehydrogenase-like predicted oxidoreductase